MSELKLRSSDWQKPVIRIQGQTIDPDQRDVLKKTYPTVIHWDWSIDPLVIEDVTLILSEKDVEKINGVIAISVEPNMLNKFVYRQLRIHHILENNSFLPMGSFQWYVNYNAIKEDIIAKFN